MLYKKKSYTDLGNPKKIIFELPVNFRVLILKHKLQQGHQDSGTFSPVNFMPMLYVIFVNPTFNIQQPTFSALCCNCISFHEVQMQVKASAL